jgi:cytochrome c-type biogenesis protein
MAGPAGRRRDNPGATGRASGPAYDGRVIALISPSYPLAFVAGVVSFLSPCVFPLVPAYAAYLGGRASRAVEPEPAVATLVAAGASASGGSAAATLGGGPGTALRVPTASAVAARAASRRLRAPVFGNGVAFVAGFCVVFIALFYVLQALEVTFLLQHQTAVNRVAGAVVILLALQIMGVLRIPFLMRDVRFHATPLGGTFGAFLLGITFALGWTPCIGPQLGAILQLAVSGSFGGLPFMLIYCAGLAVPFLLVAVLADRLQNVIRAVNRRMGVINIVAGVLLLGFGFLLLSNEITVLNQFSFQAPFDL